MVGRPLSQRHRSFTQLFTCDLETLGRGSWAFWSGFHGPLSSGQTRDQRRSSWLRHEPFEVTSLGLLKWLPKTCKWAKRGTKGLGSHPFNVRDLKMINYTISLILSVHETVNPQTSKEPGEEAFFARPTNKCQCLIINSIGQNNNCMNITMGKYIHLVVMFVCHIMVKL